MDFVQRLDYDLVVAGGGVAGVAAAVEAARSGKTVLLAEKTVQLGGLATIGLINLFVPMCNGRGVQIIKGMCDEFLRLSMKYGFDTLPEDWQRGEPGPGYEGKRMVCRYSAPIFSLALCELLNELGVEIYFDTVVTDADTEGGHIKGVTLFNKSGYTYCAAKIFIDATGDADLLHFAGVPTVTGGNYDTYSAFAATLEQCKTALETEDIGVLNKGRRSGGNANLYGKNHPEGMPLWDGTNGEDVRRYLVSNQLKMLEKIKGEDRKSRDITHLPAMCQFRTTRRIDGNYTLKGSDAYRHFEDSVCAICDFDRKDFLYEVSYGTLVKDGYDNVLAVGRCASAEGYAWDVLRVIPPAILTGQAAGAAAAQAIDSGKAVTDIDIAVLQEKLASENVMIHFPDALIPEDRTKIETEDIGHF